MPGGSASHITLGHVAAGYVTMSCARALRSKHAIQ